MAMPLGGPQRVAVERELRRGLSNREVVIRTGAHHHTVRNTRALLGGNFLCECGKPATHGGWCKFRYSLHPIRRAPTPFIRIVFGLRLPLIRCREHTYKNEERARRSFYRFICKTGRYSRLNGSAPRTAFTIKQQRYPYGYAKWRLRQATQASWEKTAWRCEFDKNWPIIQERALAKSNARRNSALVGNSSTRTFFQLSAAGGLA